MKTVKEEKQMALALEGIRVVDVSQVAAVPMAARHLADFGADVIHIENPATGDSWRNIQAGQGGTDGVPSDINYNWENFNRNKKSVTIDLSQRQGQKVLYRLVEKTDVFLTNLRPFELERFNLEYGTLSGLNPRLVYGSLNGYGRKGEEKNDPAYDATAYWSRSGMAHMLTPPGAMPRHPPGTYGDVVAALALAYGVMLGLLVRERTGIGQEVDLALFNVGLYQLSFDIAGALVTGRDYQDWKPTSREEAPNPLSGPYKTKDGRWLFLAIIQPDRYWSKFCRAIGREDLEHDPRFESHQPRLENNTALYHIIKDVFLSRTLDEWKPRLKGIPFAPVQNLPEAVADPQAQANDFFVTYQHPAYGRIEGLASPVKLSRTPAAVRMPAPEFGQHTEEVLLEHGYTWEDIERLKREQVIA